jgi:hypothetical protein
MRKLCHLTGGLSIFSLVVLVLIFYPALIGAHAEAIQTKPNPLAKAFNISNNVPALNEVVTFDATYGFTFGGIYKF